MRFVLLFALLVTELTGTVAQAQSLTEIRTQLQVALQRNLGRNMIDGALRHVDLKSGEITDFYPTENHEVILRLGDTYVMCATLTTAEGDETTVDYYVSRSGGRYSVIRTEINNRAPLKALMSAGKAIRLK